MSVTSNLSSHMDSAKNTISSETLIFHGNNIEMNELDENNKNSDNTASHNNKFLDKHFNSSRYHNDPDQLCNDKKKTDLIPKNCITTATQSSPSRDYMTLTPVKLKAFESPLKNNLFTQLEHEPLSSPTKLTSSPIAKLYKDKFNSISRDLENLLENLNSVYQKIGYSKSEIKTNEKQIFNNLSQSIEKFYTTAEEKMNRLSIDNDIEQEILNTMLEKLNDPNGLNTISDVYIRNAILLPKSKTVPDSPKKPLSLLEIQKSLKKAKSFVYMKYIPELTKFVDCNIKLQILMSCVGDIVKNFDETDQEILKHLPELDASEQCKKILNSLPLDDLDELSQTLKKNRKILLHNEKFSNIGEQRQEQIKKLTKAYLQEYNLRYSRARKLLDDTISVLKELNLNLDHNSDERFHKLLHEYDVSQSKQFLKVSDDILSELHEYSTKYNSIKHDRVKIKRDLTDNCQKLWTLLRIPQTEINTFIEENDDLSQKSLDNFENKLKELNAMKKKLVKTLIDNAWKRINEKWTILQIDSDGKQPFIEKFNQLKSNSDEIENDEKILEACENEIKELDAKLSIYAPVLKLIEEFAALQEDKLFLEQSSKDSSRLLSRNSHKILLKEEKARKRITRHFPRVICDLKKKLEEAKELFPRSFSINGEDIHDVISKQETEFKNRFPRSVLSIGNRNSTKNNLIKTNKNRIQKPKTPISKPRPISRNHIQENKEKVANIISSKHITNVTQSKFLHKTPNSKKTNTISIDTVERSLTGSKKLKRPSDSLTQIVTRSIKGSKSVSPKRLQTRLLPPTSIRKRASQLRSGLLLGVRPHLERTQTTNIPIDTSKFYQSSIPLHGIRPTRLFPISNNRLNVLKQQSHLEGQHKSKLPTLSIKTTLTPSIDTIQQKEIIDIQDFNRKPVVMRVTSNESQESALLSSPYRESKHSIYQLSMSPAGKFQLHVQQGPNKDSIERNNASKYSDNSNNKNIDMDWDTNFDDTSILEDDEMDTKFLQWKEEQLIKLDNLKQHQSRERNTQLNQ